MKRKRKKKVDGDKDKDRPAKRPNGSVNIANGTETEIPKKRKRKEKEKIIKVKKEEIVDVEDDDDDDDDDEICAAASCTRPLGDEVGWVQCDVCEKWYHLACVGLSPEKAEAMDSYSCKTCLAEGSSTNSAATTPVPASPESDNIDVGGTTPSATSPSCLVDVESTDVHQQENAVTESLSASLVLSSAEMPSKVSTIDLSSDKEDMNGDVDARTRDQ